MRFSRREKERLLFALLLSLCLHLGVWTGYVVGKKHGWWQAIPYPKWLQPATKLVPLRPPPLAQNVEPTVFIDVSEADPEPPKQAKYYSSKNSRAANPDVADANQPKLNGKQKDVPKTEDVTRLPALQPAPPPPQAQPAEPAKAVQPAKPAEAEKVQPSGDLDLVKPKLEPALAKPQAQPVPERPRTLKQARAQRSEQLPGQQMQQDGGVRRQSVRSSLDAKATPFGAYDRAIVEAVTQRWYDMLDSRKFAQDRTGKVVVRFKLKFDGTITEMQTLENTVGELLGYVCQEAVQEAAPFGAWPPDMRRMVGANYREIGFTFYYY